MRDKKNYFFVDEAGDPIFYNTYGSCIVGQGGCSKLLLVGFIRTDSPDEIRSAVLKLKDEIAADPYLKGIPSMKSTSKAFHACKDVPEVRERFFRLIKELPFRSEFCVARKREDAFKDKYKGDENIFYNALVINLFKSNLHTSKENIIYFAKRGNKDRQQPLSAAIETARLSFEEEVKMRINNSISTMVQTPIGEPCLQVIDYMNWAVQRALIVRDVRFIDFVRNKISVIFDMDDTTKKPKERFYIGKKFDITKISPL